MQRPKAVTNAVLAIWATVGLSTVVAIIDKQTGALSSDLFMGILFTYALFCVLPYKITVGRNWARYVYAILVALTLAMILAGETKDISKLALVFSYVMLPVEAWILYSLFHPDSGKWFEARTLAKP